MSDNTSPSITIPYNFKPRPYQLKFFQGMDGIIGRKDTKKKRAMLVWHRRAGKDKSCWCFLLKEAAQRVGNYFYVFPTKTMARQALWENIDSSGFKLLDHCPKEFIKRQSNQEMIIELVNGSTIRVLGYDKDPDSIRGIACTGAVFSEFAFSDEESYKTMMPALRESDGWVVFNSTPNGRNHFYDLWNNVQKSPRWFTSLLQTRWPDRPGYSGLLAPHILEEVIQEEGLSPEDVDREYGCSFNSGLQGSFYTDQINETFSSGRVAHYDYDDISTVDTFWDLGVDDSTAVWFRQRKGNQLIFIDCYEDSGKDLKFYVQMLQNKGYRYGTHYLPHDAHQRSLQTGSTTADIFAELCKNYGISDDVYVLQRASVQDGINAVRSRFKRYHFDWKCADAIKKLELYHRRYDKKRKTFLKEPVHDSNSHIADALRMEAISEDINQDGFYDLNQIQLKTDFDLW